MPYYPGGVGQTQKEYFQTKTKGEKLVKDYTGLNFKQIQKMDLDEYLFCMREAYISKLQQTEEGREYLYNCYRITQTKPEREKIREQIRRQKGANGR